MANKILMEIPGKSSLNITDKAIGEKSQENRCGDFIVEHFQDFNLKNPGKDIQVNLLKKLQNPREKFIYSKISA